MSDVTKKCLDTMTKIVDGKITDVLVKFNNDEATWNKVVVDSKEKCYIDEENSDEFVMYYESRDEFNKALDRFNGMVEYTEI